MELTNERLPWMINGSSILPSNKILKVSLLDNLVVNLDEYINFLVIKQI